MKLVYYLLFFTALAIFSCKSDSEEDPIIEKSDAKSILSFNLKAVDNSALTTNVTGLIDSINNIIVMNVANGTNIKALKPEITISDQASVSPLNGEVQDFTSPVPYTVTAEDGSTKIYTATVIVAKKSDKAILSFLFLVSKNSDLKADITAEINETDKTITADVPFGIDLTTLIPTIVISGGAAIDPISDVAKDFTAETKYTVTAEDGSKAEYLVNLNVIRRTEKDILSFDFLSSNNSALDIDYIGEIDSTNNTVKFELPYGTNISALVPTIAISEGATINPNNSVAQDFTSEVKYTVYAEDSSISEYLVNVSIAKRTGKEITAFSFLSSNNSGLDTDYEGIIDTNTNSISFLLPHGTDISGLIPTIDFSDGASITPENEIAQDFSNTVTYTVTAENGDENVYEVNVVIDDPLAITGFEPTSSITGKIVTITGTQFSENIDEISVYFNRSPAEVVSTSKTEIVVIVPHDATSGIISVSINETETVYSSDEFTVIDMWERVADFGGEGRERSFVFSANGKGYIGGGLNDTKIQNMWEYDPSVDTWTRKADYPYSGRQDAVGFGIGDLGYVATGYYGSGNANDLIKYDPSSNSWTAMASMPTDGRNSATAFTIGTKSYVGLGYGNTGARFDMWEYDSETNTWKEISGLPGGNRGFASSFVINGKGYVTLGTTSSYDEYSDLWEYDPVTDSWTQKANFPGTARFRATGFSVNNKGYIVGGITQNSSTIWHKDFWEYNPETDEWTQLPDFNGEAHFDSRAFVIENKAYLGLGLTQSGYRKQLFWVYDPNK